MKIPNSKFQIPNSGAFTLLETLVAVSVFTVAILGPMTLATYSMRSLTHGRNQITAYYLAEDALEYIKNTRDTNKLSREEWLEGLSDCTRWGTGNRCYIDTVNDATYRCNIGVAGECDVKIKYDSNSGFYNYSTGVGSVFTRTVGVKEVGDHYPEGGGGEDDEARIIVEVSWTEKSITKSFVLEGYIFDY